MHSNKEWTIASVVMNCRSENGQYSNTETAQVETHSTCHFWRCFSPFWQNSRVVAHPPTEKPLEGSDAYLSEGRKVRIMESCSCKSATPIAIIASFRDRSRTLITWSDSHGRVTPTPCTNATLLVLIAVRDYSSTVCDIQKIAGILTEWTAAVSSLEHSK